MSREIPSPGLVVPGTMAQMPLYDVNCATCGVGETSAPISEASDLRCPSCGESAPQRFSEANLGIVLIEAGGEDSPHAGRRADGTAGLNIGLPPVDRIVGTRPDGKPMIDSRPRTNHEVGSNRNAREIAKRHNLEPLSSGRYRSL